MPKAGILGEPQKVYLSLANHEYYFPNNVYANLMFKVVQYVNHFEKPVEYLLAELMDVKPYTLQFNEKQLQRIYHLLNQILFSIYWCCALEERHKGLVRNIDTLFLQDSKMNPSNHEYFEGLYNEVKKIKTPVQRYHWYTANVILKKLYIVYFEVCDGTSHDAIPGNQLLPLMETFFENLLQKIKEQYSSEELKIIEAAALESFLSQKKQLERSQSQQTQKETELAYALVERISFKITMKINTGLSERLSTSLDPVVIQKVIHQLREGQNLQFENHQLSKTPAEVILEINVLMKLLSDISEMQFKFKYQPKALLQSLYAVINNHIAKNILLFSEPTEALVLSHYFQALNETELQVIESALQDIECEPSSRFATVPFYHLTQTLFNYIFDSRRKSTLMSIFSELFEKTKLKSNDPFMNNMQTCIELLTKIYSEPDFSSENYTEFKSTLFDNMSPWRKFIGSETRSVAVIKEGESWAARYTSSMRQK